jgi:hypothetical protein
MSRVTFLEGMFANLAGVVPAKRREYLPKEKALEELKRLTGADYGYDVRAWREHFRQYRRAQRKAEKANLENSTQEGS